MTWRRLDFLLHRWIGIFLGGLVFVWFGSGVAMLYYPWPDPTGSREISLLRSFAPDSTLIGFSRARAVALPQLDAGTSEPVGARLQLIGGRLAYQFRREDRGGLLATARAVPLAVDLNQVDGRPGFDFRLADGRRVWVDAASGDARGELDETTTRRIAQRIVGDSVPIVRLERITVADEYYYARHGREVPLPVWRAIVGDRAGTRLYLDPVTAMPTAFVDAAAKRSRWLRDALHSLDVPALNNRRPLWDIVILALLLGGLAVSGSGVILLVRRMGRVVRPVSPRGPLR